MRRQSITTALLVLLLALPAAAQGRSWWSIPLPGEGSAFFVWFGRYASAVLISDGSVATANRFNLHSRNYANPLEFTVHGDDDIPYRIVLGKDFAEDYLTKNRAVFTSEQMVFVLYRRDDGRVQYVLHLQNSAPRGAIFSLDFAAALHGVMEIARGDGVSSSIAGAPNQ